MDKEDQTKTQWGSASFIVKITIVYFAYWSSLMNKMTLILGRIFLFTILEWEWPEC